MHATAVSSSVKGISIAARNSGFAKWPDGRDRAHPLGKPTGVPSIAADEVKLEHTRLHDTDGQCPDPSDEADGGKERLCFVKRGAAACPPRAQLLQATGIPSCCLVDVLGFVARVLASRLLLSGFITGQLLGVVGRNIGEG